MLRGFFRMLSLLCSIVTVLLAVTFSAFAAENVPEEAENISGKKLLEKHTGISSVNMLFDGRTKEPVKFRDGTQIILSHDGGIGSLYLVFDVEYGEYTVTNPDTRQTYTGGTDGFLHEFLDLEEIFGCVPNRVQLSFENGDGKLNEIYAFTSGRTPSFVQKWQQPADGETDIVLFSTHGDDEQLFFAGMLPYYAVERDCQVQVVYMTGHRNMSMRRSHEMLDGLWAVGIRSYPVFGSFGDYNTSSASEAYHRYLQKGISREDILSYVVEQIRRFRPKVAVGHDLAGEYGHGMHMVYAENLCDAVEVSSDPEQFPESAERYGTWDVPKTYLHLYSENPVVMDWDQPLESLGGRTPFEVTKELGFPCHVSQQTYYSWYFTGKKTAADITQYSPCEFGLYRSAVGADVSKNDFLENLTTYAQDALLEQQRLEEAARLEAEEAARLAEEAKRQQEATAPQKVQAVEQPEPDPQIPEKIPGSIVSLAVVALFALTTAVVLLASGRKNKKF